MNAGERSLIPDPEPTILMPAPGGQATVVMKRAGPAPKSMPSAGVELQRLVAGINPLIGAASTLLALVEQLRSTGTHDDPAGLRLQLLEQIAGFEAMAAGNGVPRPKITAARYLLCSFIDEAIAQTPWGADDGRRTLLQEFHDEAWGGDKAFQLLDRLGEDPQANADLLELFYVCLRLGFEGRYRGAPNGPAQLDAITARLLEVIRPTRNGAAARRLSLQAADAAVRHRDVTVLPLWLLALLTAGLLLAIFMFFNIRLDRLAQPVFHQIHALPAALRIERSEAAAKPRLAPLLQADVARGAIEVRDEAARSVVTLPADALFVPGSARLDTAQLPLLTQLAQALKDTPGQIAVIGHTDDEPVASLQFPSNWHLSLARARAVQAALVQSGAPAQRLRAEGRADAEPVLPNRSAAERARNRRVEVELRLPRPEG